MAIVNQNKLKSSTSYATMFAEVYLGSKDLDSTYLKYAEQTNIPTDKLEVDLLQGYAFYEDFDSDAATSPLYGFSTEIPAITKQAKHSIAVSKYDGDKAGTAASIQQWLSSKLLMKNQLAVEALLNGNVVTGREWDGVAALSATHPKASGSPAVNVTSATFDKTVLEGMIERMLGMTDFTGKRNLGIMPRYLIVGNSNWTKANEIVNNQLRPTSVNTSGVYDGTSNVIGATAIDNGLNMYGIEVVREPSLGSKFFLIGESADIKSKPVVFNIVNEEPRDNVATSTGLLDRPFYDFQIVGTFNIDLVYWELVQAGGFT